MSEGHLRHHVAQTELIHDSSLQCCPSQQMAEEKSHVNPSAEPVSSVSSLLWGLTFLTTSTAEVLVPATMAALSRVVHLAHNAWENLPRA